MLDIVYFITANIHQTLKEEDIIPLNTEYKKE